MLINSAEIEINTGSEAIYNALDAALTLEIYQNLLQKSQSIMHIYNYELGLQGPVLEMMLRGFRINPSGREWAIEATKTKLDRAAYIIDAIAKSIWDKGINPNSGMQLQALFYGTMRLPEIYVSKKGQVKTPMDKDTLEKLEVYFHARPLVRAVLHYRDLTKQLQVLETQVDPDWRMRSSYNIGGTVSSRFSSSKSPEGTGNNLQNIAEELRHIFIPDPGYKLYGIDLEQAESREVGLICGILFNDWAYLDACESGDLHTTVAKMTWQELPWSGDLKEDRALAETPFHGKHTKRDGCKRLGHGSNYFGKPSTLSMHTNIPVPLTTAFQKRYFTAFPSIPRWHQYVAQELQTTHRIVNVFGFERDFFGRANSDETLRSAIAQSPQSATANRLNLGMWKLWRNCPEYQLLTQLHDAVYFQAPESISEAEVARKALSYIEIEQNCNGRRFVIPGEVKVGYNWGLRKDKHEFNPKTGVCPHCDMPEAMAKSKPCVVRNPDGMRKVKY